MAKTLILLRHAKSSWSDPGLADMDRPLNKRGRDAAPRMGRWLAHAKYAPDLVICSPSVRTRQTLSAISVMLPAPPIGVRFEPDIYEAPWQRILAVLRAAEASETSQPITTVLLIGHNPGLQALTLALAAGDDGGAGDAEVRARVAQKFPTAAAAVLALPITRWADIAIGSATLAIFMTPRQLDDDT
ncbi:MAG: histidine phosphatase family protein [Pseudomonadota bacterium]